MRPHFCTYNRIMADPHAERYRVRREECSCHSSRLVLFLLLHHLCHEILHLFCGTVTVKRNRQTSPRIKRPPSAAAGWSRPQSVTQTVLSAAANSIGLHLRQPESRSTTQRFTVLHGFLPAKMPCASARSLGFALKTRLQLISSHAPKPHSSFTPS